MPEEYDAIIIGSGQGGGPLSTALVAAGKKTALIEREAIGGTCINTGCTPTKTMVASARTAHVVAGADELGIHIDGTVATHMDRVRQRKRDMVERFRSGSEKAIRDGGVDIIFGQGTFTGPHDVKVGTETGERNLRAPLIFIDVGTRPVIPEIDGLEGIPWLDSTSIMELDHVPPHLLVLGGGYIGVEFAQMFRRFGSKVTVIQKSGSLLNQEDEDVAEEVASILREDGIELRMNASVVAAFAHDDGVGLTVEDQNGSSDILGSHVLVAVGRRPNTGDLGLEQAGVEVNDRGFLRVNEKLQTTVEGVYGIGDCAGTPPFTHMSYDDFRVLRTNIIDGGNRVTTGRLVPYTVFIDPQLGRVGRTERQCRDEDIAYRVGKIPMSAVARAIESDQTRGFLKALVEADGDQILGCACLGMEGGELMAMIEIAMMGKVPYTDLRDGIFSHPTLAEAFSNLFGKLETPAT